MTIKTKLTLLIETLDEANLIEKFLDSRNYFGLYQATEAELEEFCKENGLEVKTK